MNGSEIRKQNFVDWYSRYGTPAKMGLYFNALEDPNAVLDYRATHPARPEFHQDVDRSLFPAPGHSIYEFTEVSKLKTLFENSNQVKTADDGSIKSGIGNYVMWLRLQDPETWKDEPFWDGDCVAAGTPTGRTRMATLLRNGFDYLKELENRKATYMYDKYLAAIRTKPFILLAGISGTGKSRRVRQLAQGCCPEWADAAKTVKHPLYDEQKPGNYEIIAVRPNWHDSTELMGFESRIPEPTFVIKPFVEFLVKAWMNPDIPFFLCLDEMNLAPVEQYFAEYLSAIESRKEMSGGGRTFFKTDVMVKMGAPEKAWVDGGTSVLDVALAKLFDPYKDASGNLDAWATFVREMFVKDGGVSIPPNLVVMGTVNMDETTCSFSRKVLDRAMTFELNDVSNMYTVDEINDEGDVPFGSIDAGLAKCSLLGAKAAVNSDEGKIELDPATHETVAKRILDYIKAINEKLEDTPFKIAYRSRDEIMIYCLERIQRGVVSLAQALDEATSMKILSRIEGDEDKLAAYKVVNGKKERDEEKTLLDVLDESIAASLKAANGGTDPTPPCEVCKKKLEFMKGRLSGGFTNFFV